ncbi:hypothetical protein FisN_11Lh281 [Fistulifera solaris]|uniref:HSF-type DNA-binding domain-containing protein n=1 Tax=Fistulifera solaris TaxID=1519565 RepID=A0A1Z5K0N9_FISSO|nr:hypothetical protein FisN_11Lh281 [Fistulifera solaris]|eukprot:GAX19845.1 hypothetical protein FisN_11Lh281 [Fistulifera solaris]
MSEKGKPSKSSCITEQSDTDSLSSSGSTAGSNAEKPRKTPNAGNHDSKTMGEDSQAVYHDYSKDKAMLLSTDETRESVQTFPMKLHAILSNPEFSNIVSWLPHGRAFRILQHKAFEEKVIPLYFRHGRYSSFARQVNGWGFKRIAHGPDYNSYYHELFLRGLPRLCEKMKRLSGKDEKKNAENSDAPAPDFYALSRQNPLPEDNDEVEAQVGFELNTGDAGRAAIGRGGNGFATGNSGELSLILRNAPAAVAASVGHNGSGGDVVGGLVLQALELRRNEIMQRLASLVTEGLALAPAQPRGADPLSSVLSLLTAQQQSGISASPTGNIADLLAILLQNRTNASPVRQSSAAPCNNMQGLHHLTGGTSSSQAAGGPDIFTLLLQQKGQQHFKPAANAPLQSPAPATAHDLQQLISHPAATALLRQLQGTLLDSPALPQAAPPRLQDPNVGQNGGLSFRPAVTAPSGEARRNSDTGIFNGSNNGPQLSSNIDINSLLSGGPSVLANLATLLQNQRASGDNGVEPCSAGASSLPQPIESQMSVPHFPSLNGPVPSNCSSQSRQSSTQAPNGVPATVSSLLGQMQPNSMLPTNAAPLMGQQLSQSNRLGVQDMVSQQQQLGSQISQLQALLVQPQSITGQSSSASRPNQGVDILSRLQQRQQAPDQSAHGLLALQNQLTGAGNLSIEQLQLAALLGLGSQDTSNNK